MGGGWVQHDEVLSPFNSVVAQMRLGLQWTKDNLGSIASPRVAWQIDPFGSAKVTPSLFSAFDYEYLVVNRIGDRAKEDLKSARALEFIWEGYSF